MMDFTTIITFLLLIFSTVESQKQCNDNEMCTDIYGCNFARNLITNYRDQPEDKNKNLQMLRKMFCGYSGKIPMVCCPNVTANPGSIVYIKSEEAATNRPKKPSTTALPDLICRTSKPVGTAEFDTTTESVETESPVLADPFPDRMICGQDGGSDKIFGGTVAAVDEYPWLARIKYIYNTDDNRFSFSCSATLITDRHLVTAAHCFSSINLKAISVRLGEWNTNSPKDCHQGLCADPPVEIEIESVIIHPKFNKRNLTHADIAIIKLKKSVNFTDFIEPICLPTTEYIKMQDYQHDSSYWTAGWGVTEFGEPSVVKRKVDVIAVPIATCHVALPYIPESSLPDLICAGGRQGKDSCRGDSGGPLMREVRENYKSNWFLYGVTSFGNKKCGLAGVPGAYTRVSSYMDWIRQVVQT
ncbi:CLIP domain-containing serine protease 14D-like isoform X2 [Pararge aegeria]|uniref:CLIP domain-containing serine protease 14D-like isoform X2 n=1 Tax=Pararge aegeria TaxID=116150 RepID=UPI0019CF9999|nr:CLIP domain-containing serine protease 14D-like isoform X2 [Pararge aegeria]